MIVNSGFIHIIWYFLKYGIMACNSFSEDRKRQAPPLQRTVYSHPHKTRADIMQKTHHDATHN